MQLNGGIFSGPWISDQAHLVELLDLCTHESTQSQEGSTTIRIVPGGSTGVKVTDIVSDLEL